MALAPSCPRCSSTLVGGEPEWQCGEHGTVVPLWRPASASYELFVDHLQRCGAFPTLLPWPLSPGWSVTDFGCVAAKGADATASLTSCSGLSDLDGLVEMTVISEEPGVGLGPRCAGIDREDPGADIGEASPQARLRVDGHPVPLWAVSTSDSDRPFDRSVFAGEALGRWLWLVIRPASAALLLRDEWTLCYLNDLGPELVDLPFGGGPPPPCPG